MEIKWKRRMQSKTARFQSIMQSYDYEQWLDMIETKSSLKKLD